MKETSLARILGVMGARAWLVLLLALPVVLAALWIASSQPPMYRSQVVLTFTPGPEGAADNSFLRLVPRYLLTATAPTSLGTAEAAAGLPAGELRDSVTAENPTGSLELELTAITGDAESSQTAVAALADSVLDTADEDPLVDARIVQGPTEPTDVAPTRQTVILVASVALAPVPGITLAFLLEGARPRIRVGEDLKDLGIPLVLSARRRTLRRVAASARDRASADVFMPLRLWVVPRTAQPGAAVVVVTSATPSEGAAVAWLAEVLSPVSGRDGDEGQIYREAYGVLAVARAGLLTDSAAQAAVRDHGRCVLVVSTGLDVEVARQCMQVLEQLTAGPIGGVLVR